MTSKINLENLIFIVLRIPLADIYFLEELFLL